MNPLESDSSQTIAGSQEQMHMTEDPYVIRAQFLKHERSIKTIARVNIIFGALFAAMFAPAIVMLLVGGDTSEPGLLSASFCLTIGGAAGVWLGIALNQLKPWARVALSILYVPSLIAIPIGTIIGGFFIWTLLHKKARFICSEEYQSIIAATPDIKWYSRGGKTSSAESRQQTIKKAA